MPNVGSPELFLAHGDHQNLHVKIAKYMSNVALIALSFPSTQAAFCKYFIASRAKAIVSDLKLVTSLPGKFFNTCSTEDNFGGVSNGGGITGG